MKKFNRLFEADRTLVKIKGFKNWWLVKDILSERSFIAVYGLERIFKREDIIKFNNTGSLVR